MILAVLLFGCAGRNVIREGYVVPPEIKARVVATTTQLDKCLVPSKPLPIRVSDSPTVNGWYDHKNNSVFLTAGLFSLSDDAVYFVLAHEIAHEKLGHAQAAQAVSGAVTGAMLIAGAIVPGLGLLNHAINPAIVNNYNKTQEAEADAEASKACVCTGMSKERIVSALTEIKKSSSADGGGFWDRHPSWDDRLANIQTALQ